MSAAGPPDRSDARLVITRRLRAPRQAVFEAWTTADSLRHWMCPGDITGASATLDVRVGGRFRIVMHGPTGDVEHEGEYLTVEPPERLVFTWISSATGHRPSLVTVELRERGDETELILVHERLPGTAPRDRHDRGWRQILQRLAVALGDDAATDSPS